MATAAVASPDSSGSMQRLGSTAGTSDSPGVGMPVDEMIDVGPPPWTTAAAAAAAVSPVGGQAVTAAPEKMPHAVGAETDHDASFSAFELDIEGGSYEELIAGGIDEFFDAFRALDGPDGGDFADGLYAADQGMEVDDDEIAWQNSPDAFMPLPITDGDDLGQMAATVVPTGEGEGEEEAGMAPGIGDDNMEEDVGGASLVASLAVPEATVETAPAAAAAVAATTILPPVALEGDTVEDRGVISGGEHAVSPHAPAYEFGVGGGAGGAGNLLAGGPADGTAAVVGAAVGVEVAAVATAMAVAPTATNMIMVNGGGGSGGAGGTGGGYDGGPSQKELIRRQKVERYLAKKKSRRWSRASSYQSRQRVANSRPRHKGRFLPLVSQFVPISELKRRQRALMAQQAAEKEEKQASSLTPLAAAGWGASAQFPAEEDYRPGQGEG